MRRRRSSRRCRPGAIGAYGDPQPDLAALAASLAFGAKPKLAVPLAIIAPFAINLIFLKLLRVPLPGGILPFPW